MNSSSRHSLDKSDGGGNFQGLVDSDVSLVKLRKGSFPIDRTGAQILKCKVNCNENGTLSAVSNVELYSTNFLINRLITNTMKLCILENYLNLPYLILNNRSLEI